MKEATYLGNIGNRKKQICNIINVFEQGDYVDIVFKDGLKATVSIELIKVL